MTFSSVTIIGSGPRGCILAIGLARGAQVTLVRAGRADAAAVHRTLSSRLAAAVERGEVSEAERTEIVSRIQVAGELAEVDAELVIDATSSPPRARRALLATLEGRLSDAAVLASIAAPDELAKIAEVLRRPDQFVGVAFDTERVDVDIAPLPDTAPGVVAACRAFVAYLGRTPHERESIAPRVGYREWLSDSDSGDEARGGAFNYSR